LRVRLRREARRGQNGHRQGLQYPDQKPLPNR
jgi:hypothetical protein